MRKNKGRVDYEGPREKVKVDKKDLRILMLLAQDARMPASKISKQIRLSRDAVDYRIKRLVEKGIIVKFFANLHYDRLGYYVFHLFLLMDEMSASEEKKLHAWLEQHPAVFSVIEYSDRWDLEVVLIAQDLVQFDHFIMELSASFPHSIMEKDKLEIIKRFNVRFVPQLTKEQQLNEVMLRERLLPYPIDKTERSILKLLSENCRDSSYDMAARLGISPDTVRYRMKRLVKENIIKNYSILVNLSALGFHWYTLTVSTKIFDTTHESALREFLRQHPNIIRAAKTLGGWDLIFYVVVDRPRQYHQLVKEFKKEFAPVIKNYQTWVAYKEHVFKTMPEVLLKNPDSIVAKPKILKKEVRPRSP